MSNAVRQLKTPLLQANGLLLLGHARLTQQQWAAAEQAYTQADTIYQSLANRVNGAEAWAGLALVALATGEPSRAFTLIEALLPLLQNNRAVGYNEPFFVYLAAYRVLSIAGDERAAGVLAAGHALLQRDADQIEDAALRQSFWAAVPVHRQLQQLYAAMQ